MSGSPTMATHRPSTMSSTNMKRKRASSCNGPMANSDGMPTTFSKRTYPHDTSSSFYPALDGEDSFRVMYLQPGAGDDEIHVRLQTVSHHDSPNYEAVSYAWGDPSHKVSIKSDCGPLQVTPNLVNALRAVRWPNRERCLWADAICINQEDLLERNHQVKQMARLFANATSVLVWLGLDSRGFGAKVFEYAHKLENRSIIMFDNDSFRHATDLLQSLRSRPWFQRLWTTQEIGMASQAIFLCGASAISWDSLLEAYRMIDSPFLSNNPSGASQSLPWRSDILKKWTRPTQLNFLALIESVQDRTSSDPRDRIFALLAHPSATIENPILKCQELIVEPDYRMSYRQVYTEATKRIIEQMGNLDVLSHVRRGGPVTQERTGLPSWVPNWNEPQSASPLTIHDPDGSWSGPDRTPRRRWSACGRGKGVLSASPPQITEGSELRTQGFCYDCIDRVLDDWTLHALFTSKNSKDDDISKRKRPEKYIWPSEPERFNWPGDLIRMLRNNHVPSDFPKYRRDAMRLDEIRALWDWLNDVPDRENKFDHFLRYIGANMSENDNRRFFVTVAGRIGLALQGPSHKFDYFKPKPRDGIFILSSGRVPYILRGNDDDTYRLIGDCYMQHFMFGEALEFGWAPHEVVIV